ncbi:MAG: EamA family transporter [Pyrobaculum sp.]
MDGVVSALAATLAFSINAPLAYAASNRGVTPTTLVAIRNIAALAFLLPLADFKTPPDLLALIVASALLGPGLGDYAYFKAMSHSGVPTAVTVGYTYIFAAYFFSIFLGVEVLKARALAGALLAFLGIYIALGGKPWGAGVLYGAMASLSWGMASAILGAVAKDVSPFTIAAVRTLALVPPFLAMSSFKAVTKSGVFYATASGLVGMVFGSLAFIYAIAHIGVSATVVTTAFTPLLSQIFDKALNRTTIDLKHVAGALSVASGVAMVMNN